ncbi:hypothetical protein RRG08_017151 [Elysia crispata]|uniref:Uncharacterized protein n=1 Tax=Elysia crispata TaxID=231223 RepID=A0AAE1B3G8_9GAST|nr:hypothetical protein RRG08_017151 [Elysia crispata]
MRNVELQAGRTEAHKSPSSFGCEVVFKVFNDRFLYFFSLPKSHGGREVKNHVLISARLYPLDSNEGAHSRFSTASGQTLFGMKEKRVQGKQSPAEAHRSGTPQVQNSLADVARSPLPWFLARKERFKKNTVTVMNLPSVAFSRV